LAKVILRCTVSKTLKKKPQSKLDTHQALRKAVASICREEKAKDGENGHTGKTGKNVLPRSFG